VSDSIASISLRDPGGRVCLVDNRVIRVVNGAAISDLHVFLGSAAFAEFRQSKNLVSTEFLDAKAMTQILRNEAVRLVYEQSPGATIVEHERVPFPSFPYEWPAEMLHAAGELTLDFAEKLLEDGLGLKDASPYNVLFHGSRPVFVDLLSFEPRDSLDPIWLPLAQFVRTFLLPLLVSKHFSVGLPQLLTTHRDGLEPEEVFALLSPLQKISQPFLTLVSIPVYLAPSQGVNNGEVYRNRNVSSPGKAHFILGRVLRNTRRKLRALKPPAERKSMWSDYMDKNNYSPDYFPLKQAFVRDVMREYQPQTVLDVGCNTGHFSVIAAMNGASVVAIDSDSQVVGAVWRKASARELEILPLVVNLARPTPSIGWRNSECPSFLERARGAFESVFMLGVIHHLLVSERIPLTEIITLAAELTTDSLVIEFVAPADPMFRSIARGRDHLYSTLTKELFEATCRTHFDIVKCARLGDTSRWLYLMRKRKGTLIECFEMQQ
jgi:SAM-dependent methyltransferase